MGKVTEPHSSHRQEKVFERHGTRYATARHPTESIRRHHMEPSPARGSWDVL